MARRDLTVLAWAASHWPTFVGALLIIALWQGSVAFFQLPPYVLPSLGAIVDRMVTERASLLQGAAMTGTEALAGFALGIVAGVSLAIVMTMAPRVERVLLPVVVGINSVPVVAYAPLMLIWLGIGPASKIAMASIAVGFVMLLNALQGLKATDPAAIALLRSFGAGPLRILMKLRIPMAMPSIVNGLRVGIVRSVLVVIVSEMLGAYRGLGWMIYESTQQTDFLRVWAAVFTASAGSLLLYGLLVVIDRKVVWWR